MALTIIETGRPPPPLNEGFEAYPNMILSMLKPHLSNKAIADCANMPVRVVAPIDGAPLPHADEVTGLVITGSAHGVYDALEWIEPLKQLVRDLAVRNIPQVGICFGHQLIAEAMGGKVEKVDRGWGIGRHLYDLTNDGTALGFKLPEPDQQLAMLVSHQDQVVMRPENAKVIAASDFTPNAALSYENAPILTFQGHPEFPVAFSRALIEMRRGVRFAPELADAALAKLDDGLHHDHVARWIANHLKV